VLSARSPSSVGELGPTERAQLELAARKHDGKRVAADKRFGPDDGSETSFGSTILFATLGENGAPRYDAVLFGGDAGSVFRHGTTTEVAARIQGSVEARNPDLAARLSDALAKAESLAQGAKRTLTKKATAKKASAKKASAKKASAKKASAKKASAKKASAKKASAKKATAKRASAKRASART
jgi:hypothetical protein